MYDDIKLEEFADDTVEDVVAPPAEGRKEVPMLEGIPGWSDQGGTAFTPADPGAEVDKTAFERAMQKFGAFAQNAGDMAAFNQTAELASWPQAAWDTVTGTDSIMGVDEDASFSERRKAIRDNFQGQQDSVSEEAPGWAMAGDVAGALQPLSGPMQMATKGYNALRGSSFVRNAAAAAGLGATEGGILAYGDDTSVGGGVVGGAVGGALGAGVGEVVKRVGGKLSKAKIGQRVRDWLVREHLPESGLDQKALKEADSYLTQSADAVDLAQKRVEEMVIPDPNSPVVGEKLKPLQEAVEDDLVDGIGTLNRAVNKVTGIGDDATSKLAKWDADYTAAHRNYENMVDMNSTKMMDIRKVQRAVNDGFNSTVKGVKGGALTGKALAAQTKYNKQMQKLFDQMPNGQMNFKSLLELRKELAQKMRVKDPGKLGNAYAGYAATVKKIDGMLDDASGGLYSRANNQYSVASAFKDGMEDGRKLYGNTDTAADVEYNMNKHMSGEAPLEKEAVDALNEGRRAGFAQAMQTDMDKGIVAGLQRLLGDGNHPGKLNAHKLAKVEQMFPGSTEDLKDVFYSVGPRVESLNKLNHTLQAKLLDPAYPVQMKDGLNEAQIAAGLMTKGPGAMSSPAFVSAFAKATGQAPETGIMGKEAEGLLDFLNASGGDFQKKARNMGMLAHGQDMLDLAPEMGVGGGAVVGQELLGEGAGSALEYGEWLLGD
jgi:hypothetical protein